MSEQGHTGGRQTFLGLAVVILGGLLFAAGVMVGRQMGVGGEDRPGVSLDRIDRRDEGSPGPQTRVDGGSLDFPRELSRPSTGPARPSQPVKVEAKPVADAGTKSSKPAPKERAANAVQPGSFALQVASYRDSSQAQALLSRLRGKGYGKARMVQGEVPGKGTYFRVRLGPFPDRETAEKHKQKLLGEQGLKALVVVEE